MRRYRFLLAPFLVLALFLSLGHQVRANALTVTSITADCSGNGTITVENQDYWVGKVLTLFVEYHIPGDSDFHQSGQQATVTLATGQTVYPFTINMVAGVPAEANTIRIGVVDVSNEKSDSFGPCGEVPTNTPVYSTHTPVPPTDTPYPTHPATDTPVPPTETAVVPSNTPTEVSTDTPTEVPTNTPTGTLSPSATPTDTPVVTNTPEVVPSATSSPTNTAVPPTKTPVVPVVTPPTQLPNTGSGTDGSSSSGIVAVLAVFAVFAIVGRFALRRRDA